MFTLVPSNELASRRRVLVYPDDTNQTLLSGDTWGQYNFGAPLNSTIRLSIDTIIESIFDGTTNKTLTSLKTACQLILRNFNVHNINLKQVNISLYNFREVFLIPLKSKCSTLSDHTHIDQVNTDLFGVDDERIKCNSSRVPDCKPIYANLFFTQMVRNAIQRSNWTEMNSVRGELVQQLCSDDLETFVELRNVTLRTSLFQDLEFTEGANLSSLICAEHRKMDSNNEQVANEDLIGNLTEKLFTAFRSFFGKMELEQMRRVWCKVALNFLADPKEFVYLTQLNRSSSIVEYMGLRSLHTCFFNYEANENEMMMMMKSDLLETKLRGYLGSVLDKIQVEFEKYQKLLQEQFQLHSKTLKDEFEGYVAVPE
jgi:hypothetical protein